jgi:GTP-binding protein Era
MKMNNINQKSTPRAGFVAVVGRPNVGKSTLINSLLGQKIAAVSPRPQTTRQRQLGILTLPEGQIVFMDTPGIHLAHHALGRAMNGIAREALQEADVIVWIVDSSQPPTDEDRLIAGQLKLQSVGQPLILALNKIDLLEGDRLAKYQQEFTSLIERSIPIQISALSGYGLAELQASILEKLPEGDPFYSADQVTDFYERQIASDLIREAALDNLRDEVPHALAVRVDEYKERENQAAFISATLFVEKESQKGIVIGRAGEMLKRIGIQARRSIEEMSGRKVFLEMRVKVSKNWRNDANVLRQMGFNLDQEEG